MASIAEKRAIRHATWEKTKSFLGACTGENGMVSDENLAIYNRMEEDVIAQGREIQRLERQAAIDAEMSAPTSAAIVNTPARPTGDQKTGRASDEYRRDFLGVMRGRPVTNLLQEQIQEDGGFLVPLEFERQIVVALEEANILRQLGKTIHTAAPRKIPIASTPSVATWVDEAAAIPESAITFGQKSLDAFKLSDMLKISQELLQDSMFDLEAYIATDIARAFAAAEEESFCIGDGIGKPTGIFTEAGGVVGVTAASQTAITFDDLINLVYALKSPYRRSAAFLTNDATVGSIRKLKDANGQYLWTVSLQTGQPDRVLGFPIYTSPYVPKMTAGALSVAFGDYSNFWIADRAGRTVQRLNELFAQNGLIGYVATERVDAKVITTEGIQLLAQAR